MNLPTPSKPPIKLKKKQLKYVMNYYDPNSETFGNSYQSARNAGFSDSYAKIVSSPSVQLEWVSEAKRLMNVYTPDHIYAGLQDIAQTGDNRDKLRAYELMGKANGMFVDRQQREVSVTFKNEMPRPSSEIIDGEVV